ncbi:MAG: hypothetical protein J5523_07590 [Muribaculaceae bacterium]|nr:hypothetical protein [Muribaculaceae bacterium]
MKKTILFLILAVISVASIHAQETRKAIYVIDGKQVENFDGSQLAGKTIVNYSIDPEHNLHSIITSDMTGGKEVKSVKVLSTSKVINSDESVSPGVTTNVIRTESDEIIYVLDGRIVPYSEILSMSTSKLDSMTVIKDKENHDFKKFANEYMKTSKKAPTCVILITTKK